MEGLNKEYVKVNNQGNLNPYDQTSAMNLPDHSLNIGETIKDQMEKNEEMTLDGDLTMNQPIQRMTNRYVPNQPKKRVKTATEVTTSRTKF